jgi:creatinine deaminase
VYAGESETFSGAKEFMQAYAVRVIDLNMDECKNMMKDFITNNPTLWNEDIGEL